jgi:putative nucleotidyltransferase with HDIG domain
MLVATGATRVRAASPFMTNPVNSPPAFRFLQAIAADLGRKKVAFPTFSRATMKIRAALERPDLDADRLAQVISTEPLLAARLVQMANSAALHPGGRPIGDVRSAIMRVGVAAVKSVAVAVAMEQLRTDARSPAAQPFAEAAWRHSVEVAAVAFVLAKRLSRISPDEALFAGLVHDIGHFYLLSKAKDYPELEHDADELHAVLAEWHPSIGRAVLHEFQLSDALLDAVAEHENAHYRMPLRALPDLVTLANLVCGATNPVATYRTAAASIKFEPEVANVLSDAKAEIHSLASVLRG